jgi:hypothetical protein
MAPRRADSYPDARSRAILAGRNPAETPNYRLAARIRTFNARLADLPAETVRELQPDWLESWAGLQANLKVADGDTEARFTAIDAWSSYWDERLPT